MELGQDLLRTTAGEAFTPAAARSTSTARKRRSRRAMALAEELGDDGCLRRRDAGGRA